MVVAYNDIINAIAKAEDVALYNARSRAVELSNGCKPSKEDDNKAIEIESWIQLLTRAKENYDHETCLTDDIIWEIIQDVNEQNRNVDCDVSRTFSKHSSSGNNPVPYSYVERVLGLYVDNTNPSKPIIKIFVNPSTISGNGTESSPFSAIGGSGSGDVVGPSLAVNNNIALFNTTTGKLIKDGGYSVSTSTSETASSVKVPVWSVIVSYVTGLGYLLASTAASTYQAILTAANMHTFVDSLSTMTTPADADRMLIVDNSASLAKKITWANIKATLKTYFDTIYTTTSAVASQITTALSGYLTSAAAAATYQVILLSGTNIKTINGNSLLGSGNLVVGAASLSTTTGGVGVASTSNTYSNGLLVPENLFTAGMMPLIRAWFEKSATNGNCIIRLYVNDTNNLAGSPILLATSTTFGSTTRSSVHQRILNIIATSGAGSTKVQNTTFASNSDIAQFTTAVSSLNIDWTTVGGKYIVASVQNGSASDTTTVTAIKIDL